LRSLGAVISLWIHNCGFFGAYFGLKFCETSAFLPLSIDMETFHTQGIFSIRGISINIVDFPHGLRRFLSDI